MTSSCAVAVRRSCAVHVLGSCDGRWALLAITMMNNYSGEGSITLLSTTSDLSPRVFWLCAASRRLVSAQPGITLAWTPFHHAGHVLLIQEMCRDMQAVKRIGLMLVVFAISGIVKFRRLVRSICKPLLHYDSLVRQRRIRASQPQYAAHLTLPLLYYSYYTCSVMLSDSRIESYIEASLCDVAQAKLC